jgi:hypothetical protein
MQCASCGAPLAAPPGRGTLFSVRIAIVVAAIFISLLGACISAIAH